MNNTLQKLNTALLAVIAVCLMVITAVLIIWPKTAEDAAGADGMIAIDTPYVTLSYSAEWEDTLRYESETNGDVFTQTYYCCVGDKEEALFTICFGDAAQGSLIGYVNHDGTPVPFTVQSMSLTSEDGWTQEELDTFYAMQDAVNEIIQSVTSSEAYVNV